MSVVTVEPMRAGDTVVRVVVRTPAGSATQVIRVTVLAAPAEPPRAVREPEPITLVVGGSWQRVYLPGLLTTGDWNQDLATEVARISHTHGPQEGLNSPRHDGGDGLERRPPAGTARRRRAAGRTPRSEVAPARRESQRSAGPVQGVTDTVCHSAGHVPAFREGGRQGTARDPGGRCVESHRQEPAAPSAIRHLICWWYVPRREPSRRWGSSPPRPCGPLCRPEAGVPSRPRDSSPWAVRGFLEAGVAFRRCVHDT